MANKAPSKGSPTPAKKNTTGQDIAEGMKPGKPSFPFKKGKGK